MTEIDRWLIRILIILLSVWCMWITKQFKGSVNDMTSAIQTFNANFGPALPPQGERK